MNIKNNDKFTESARMALQYAQEEAQRLHHSYIGTEHLVLGLFRDRSNHACRALFVLNVDPKKVQEAIESIIGSPDRQLQMRSLAEIGLTPRGKRVIELAVDEARRLPAQGVQIGNIAYRYVDTDSLLIGLIREGEGIAAGVLESLGVNLESARRAVFQVHAQEISKSAEAATSPVQETPVEPLESVQKRGVAVVETKSQRPYMSYAFTEQAHRILEQAEDRALHLDHNYIGSEHLLLGILDVSEGAGSVVLYNLGVEPKKFRNAILYIIGAGKFFVDKQINLTPRSYRILQAAYTMAQIMKNDYVGSEHLLLGILEENGGMAMGILENLGVDLELALPEIARVLKEATYE